MKPGHVKGHAKGQSWLGAKPQLSSLSPGFSAGGNATSSQAFPVEAKLLWAAASSSGQWNPDLTLQQARGLCFFFPLPGSLFLPLFTHSSVVSGCSLQPRVVLESRCIYSWETSEVFLLLLSAIDGFYPVDCFTVPLSFAGLKTLQIVSIVL